MKHKAFRQAFLKLSMLAAVCFTAFGFTANFGLDSYEIYLNNKLILKQFVNQPVNLRKLQLDKANDRDELLIYYKHCTMEGAGTGRSIAIKDESGKILKKWEFSNSKGSDAGMVIPVKELLALEKQRGHDGLSLHYTAQELPKGEMLAVIGLE